MSPPLPPRAATDWVGPLIAVVLMQLAIGFLTRVLVVAGPVLTSTANVPSEQIGQLSALIIVGTLIGVLVVDPLLTRFGSLRVLQAATVLGSAGLLVALSGNWAGMMIAA